MKKIQLQVLLAVFAFSSPAFAGNIFIGALGGLNRAQLALSPMPSGVTLSSGNNFAGGLALGIPLVPMFGIEMDGIYARETVTMKQSLSAGTATVAADMSLTMSHIQIPVMVRFSPIDLFSIGAGVFGAMGMGDVTQSADVSVTIDGTTSAATHTEKTETYAAAKLSTVNFGAVGSATLMFPVAPMISVGVDARYLLGLNNLSTSGTTTSSFLTCKCLPQLDSGFNS